MALNAFRNPKQDTQPTQALASAMKDFTRQLEQNPLMDGRILSDIAVGTASTNIVHGLGREFVGWFVVRNASTATVREAATQTKASQFLTLVGSAPTTVSIYIF